MLGGLWQQGLGIQRTFNTALPVTLRSPSTDVETFGDFLYGFLHESKITTTTGVEETLTLQNLNFA